MSILKIAKFGHPTLHNKASLVENIAEPSIKKLIHDMSETMIDARGIGLAAPQVHVNKQIMIFRSFEAIEEKNDAINITALINPKIKEISNETENDWEACLSLPGMQGLVKRFSKIQYEGFDMNGKVIKKEVEGIHARVVQHEYDHLMGIVYTERLVNDKAFGFSEEIEEYWKKNE
tara:strand:+ start:582 stop:1109 length:528 start_codon:yes stop_codon:yes gene_type:complete